MPFKGIFFWFAFLVALPVCAQKVVPDSLQVPKAKSGLLDSSKVNGFIPNKPDFKGKISGIDSAKVKGIIPNKPDFKGKISGIDSSKVKGIIPSKAELKSKVPVIDSAKVKSAVKGLVPTLPKVNRETFKSKWQASKKSNWERLKSKAIRIEKGEITASSQSGERVGEFPGDVPIDFSAIQGRLSVDLGGLPFQVSGLLTTQNNTLRQSMNYFTVSFDGTRFQQQQKALREKAKKQLADTLNSSKKLPISANLKDINLAKGKEKLNQKAQEELEKGKNKNQLPKDLPSLKDTDQYKPKDLLNGKISLPDSLKQKGGIPKNWNDINANKDLANKLQVPDSLTDQLKSPDLGSYKNKLGNKASDSLGNYSNTDSTKNKKGNSWLNRTLQKADSIKGKSVWKWDKLSKQTDSLTTKKGLESISANQHLSIATGFNPWLSKIPN